MKTPAASARPLNSPRAVEEPTSPVFGDADAETNLVFSAALVDDPPVTLDHAQVRDWQRVLQLASDENAVITLRNRLRGADIPVGVERYLAILALDREYRMRRLEQRLEQTLVVLNDAGIDVLLLKGGALACSVYGSFTARPMRDIDVLVRPERSDHARALMLQLDWECDPDVPGDRSYGTHHHLPPMRDPRAGGLRLEIHRAVLPPGHPFRLTEDEMWCAARRVQVGRAHALVMRPAHHAVHIAIHFAWSHMLRMGAWQAFRDLSALAASGRFDWEDFVSTASRWGATSAAYWTLRLAAALSKLPVPDAVLARLQPRFAGTCGRPLMRHFVNGLVRRDACPSVRLDQALWTIAMQPGSEGHGRIRPWSVSQDLLFALEQRGQLRDRMVESPLVQMGRSGRYLSEIIA